MLKVILKFDGHDFYGWQFQTQTSPTVQENFNKALEAIYKVPVKTMASGRTDTGVHSLEHHVVFKEPFNIPCEKLIKALNSNLPDSIRVFECNSVDDHFRPTNDAIKREYRYFFSNDEIVNPFSRKFMSNISYNLDYKMMEKACELFIGEHDFNSFHCVGSNPTSTVRTIFNCELSKQDSCMNGVIPGHYVVSVTGSGFLKQMVRLIVGAIWDVGRGKLTLEEIKTALSEASGKHVSSVAPAQGLFKFSVEYPN